MLVLSVDGTHHRGRVRGRHRQEVGPAFANDCAVLPTLEDVVQLPVVGAWFSTVILASTSPYVLAALLDMRFPHSDHRPGVPRTDVARRMVVVTERERYR